MIKISKEILNEKKVLSALILLTALNMADLITTLIGLRIYEELNIIIKYLYEISPALMIFYKLLLPVVPFVYLFYHLNKEKKSLVETAVANSVYFGILLVTGVYIFVVLHNIFLLVI
uniref:DUF5658 domain-containing protein n=1 Tax=Geoglobus ahangari TaxID=113653 RepID=A0A7C3UDL1_9EURY